MSETQFFFIIHEIRKNIYSIYFIPFNVIFFLMIAVIKEGEVQEPGNV